MSKHCFKLAFNDCKCTFVFHVFDHILFLHVLSSNNLIFILAPTTTEKRVLHYKKNKLEALSSIGG